METARMNSNGQVTIPLNIRKKLNLKDGANLAFVEKDGDFIIKSQTMIELEAFHDGFKGVAEKLDLKTDQDIVDLIKQVRRESKEDPEGKN